MLSYVLQQCLNTAYYIKFVLVYSTYFYRLPHFQGDLIAGFTVGLTVIPQGLALAQLAELPPQVIMPSTLC